MRRNEVEIPEIPPQAEKALKKGIPCPLCLRYMTRGNIVHVAKEKVIMHATCFEQRNAAKEANQGTLPQNWQAMPPTRAQFQNEIEEQLKRNGYKNIAWKGDCVEAEHERKQPPSMRETITPLGYFIPCSGKSGKYYAQIYGIHTKGEYSPYVYLNQQIIN